MKRLPQILRILAGFAFVSATAVYAVEPDFVIDLSMPQTVIRPGEDVLVHVVLTNTSGKALPAGFIPGFRHPEFSYSVSVRRTDGAPGEDTWYGDRIRRNRFGIVSAILRQLQEKEQIAEDLDLSKLFDLSKPGTYIVELTRESLLHPGTFIRSNAFSIKVMEASVEATVPK